ncbi:sigma-70 family RNA polymerase sigma factor [Kitasatospora sp. NPDC086791]|uniref:RNA polymerase sigma factor n=1 Tax=Kitasatospora sp. NPDC086791 TaxID=3155178 RepID=UPI00341FB274
MSAPPFPKSPARSPGEVDQTRGQDPTDAELLQRVRQGDMNAYGALFRRHRGAVHRYAAGFARSHDGASDLTAEAFTRVLHAVQAGVGPSTSFLGYVLTTLRRTAGEWGRAAAKAYPVADLSEFERDLIPEADSHALARFEHTTVAQAFSSLPARWRLILWHTAIEGTSPAQAADLLGLTPSGASALAYRAREGLRRAYLTGHARTDRAACHKYIARFGAHARGGLGAQATRLQEHHMRECPSCRNAFTEVRYVERLLQVVDQRAPGRPVPA